jgi:AAA+ superfamily predicted ATPase
MDILLSSVGDIAKHLIQSQINTNDKTLDIKVIGLTSVFISILIKWLITVLDIDVRYWLWYIYYHILGYKCFNLILFGNQISTDYKSYYEVKICETHEVGLSGKINVLVFYKILSNLYRSKLSINRNLLDSFISNIVPDNTVEYNYDVNDIFIDKTLKISPQYKNTNGSLYKSGYYIAHINGYFIYIKNINLSEHTKYFISFGCESQDALKIFIEYLKKEADKIDKSEMLIINSSIYEPENNNGKIILKEVGKVKKNLTMDNYVSKHKKNLIEHLDAFQNNKLFDTNPYLENNLGILLHGGYGTGKSYIITAISNYLGRSICNVNFAKIKTISEFRLIMTEENCKKYVFCFDEFDYLLADILNSNQSTEAKADIQFKVNILNNQLSAVKDDKELSDKIINDMKNLISSGTSNILTYSALLSELSGINSVTGRIIIATTNFIDKIPGALIRPGRFDLIYELGCFNSVEIRELLSKLYKPTGDEVKQLNNMIFPKNKYTPSELILQSCRYPDLIDMIEYLGGKPKSNTIKRK